MTCSITLLTSAGAVRVAGENLVIDLREVGGDQPEEIASETLAIQGVEGGAQAPSAEKEITIPETPAISSQPVTAAGADSLLPSVPAPHSSDDAFAAVTGKAQLANAAGVEPSKPEACAGGPASAQATPSKPIVHDLTLPAFLDRRAKKDAA